MVNGANSSATSPTYVGIDFGTSKCVMAYASPEGGTAEIIRIDGNEEMPSLVFFGDGATFVGEAAQNMLEDSGERTRIWLSVKRDIAKPIARSFPGRMEGVQPVEAATRLFAKLKHEAETRYFDQSVSNAVITCPATFTQQERDRIVEAAQAAGFAVVELLEEPVAAALAFAEEGLGVGREILVYDLGAGTFDIALLAAEETARQFRLALDPTGHQTGGDDFDRALYGLCDEIAVETLNRHLAVDAQRDPYLLLQCRKWKRSLTDSGHCLASALLPGGEGFETVRFRAEITRLAFEERIAPLVEETVRLTRSYLQEAAKRGLQVDTVLLIGGSSRVPLVERLLTADMPVAMRKWHKQDHAVALGAAYWARELWAPARTLSPPPTPPFAVR